MEGFLNRDGDLSSPGAAGPLTPRAGSTSPSQAATSQWGWDFHIVRGDVNELSESYIFGRISSPGMGPYPLRGALALCTIPSQLAIG